MTKSITSLNLDDKLLKMLNDIGEQQGRSVSWLVNNLLTKALIIPEKQSKVKSIPSDQLEAAFAYWWDRYPAERRIAKTAKCWPKWKSICKGMAQDEVVELTNTIANDIKKRLSSSEAQFFPNSTTYLNQKRWEDG